MKIHKLEKINEGKNPVIRVTYTKWLSSKKRVRDAIKSGGGVFWVWYDNPNTHLSKCRTLDVFHNNNEHVKEFNYL
tara:strand:- start:41 stop:268 length:228 start_codon:yes stop_codon:yes gene_type:complete